MVIATARSLYTKARDFDAEFRDILREHADLERSRATRESVYEALHESFLGYSVSEDQSSIPWERVVTYPLLQIGTTFLVDPEKHTVVGLWKDNAYRPISIYWSESNLNSARRYDDDSRSEHFKTFLVSRIALPGVRRILNWDGPPSYVDIPDQEFRAYLEENALDIEQIAREIERLE